MFLAWLIIKLIGKWSQNKLIIIWKCYDKRALRRPLFYLICWRWLSIKQLRQNNDGPILNEDIRSKEMLVITEEGEKLGILSRKDALAAAQDKGLDLVLIQPQAKPQVAKIMDYSKFRYEQQKKAREQRKNQKVVQIQEIRMTPTIESNDLIVKANKARKILEKGNKIKVSVRFYGRLMTRQDLGQAVIDKFV